MAGSGEQRGAGQCGTYQCVTRQHLQQRDEVVPVPQVLVQVVDMALRLWGQRCQGGWGQLSIPHPCQPTPGWAPSDPPAQRVLTHSPKCSWCPQCHVPPKHTQQLPPCQDGSSITLASLWHAQRPTAHHAGLVPPPTMKGSDPLPTTVAAPGVHSQCGERRVCKEEEPGGTERERGRTYLCSPVLRRAERREQLGESREGTQDGQSVVAPRWHCGVRDMWRHIGAGAGACPSVCRVPRWGSARGHGPSTLTGKGHRQEWDSTEGVKAQDTSPRARGTIPSWHTWEGSRRADPACEGRPPPWKQLRGLNHR